MKIKRLTVLHMAVLAVLGLPACATMPRLPAGGPSLLARDSSVVRSQLVIAPVPLSQPPRYRPVNHCSYRVSMPDSSGGRIERIQNMTMRRVRDRLLVTSKDGANTSTALLGQDGKVYDFNTTGRDGSRTTGDNFLRSSQDGGASINPVNLAFPDYLRPSLSVGESVAWVQHQSGWPWGYYVYRGTTSYKGTEAIVLDLTTPVPNREPSEWPTVGFSIIDLKNSLPMFYVLDAGVGLRVERIACQ